MSGNGDLAVVAGTDGVFTVDPTTSFASNGFYGNCDDDCKNEIEKNVIDFSKLYFTLFRFDGYIFLVPIVADEPDGVNRRN